MRHRPRLVALAVSFLLALLPLGAAAGPLGSIAGTVTSAVWGSPLTFTHMSAYDAAGEFVRSSFSAVDGTYQLVDLPAGSYFVIASPSIAGYLTEIYDDLHCSPGNCDPTTGTPVPVTAGAATTGIDFVLEAGPGIAGRVLAQGDGAPLSGVRIDIWGTAGELVGISGSNPDGTYLAPVDAGSYYVSTDAGSGYIDEVFDDLACPQGSASDGLCDPTLGSLVVVEADSPPTENIDFALWVSIFADGFETGNTSAWSIVVP